MSPIDHQVNKARRQLLINAWLHRLGLSFLIGAGGRVQQARVRESTLDDATVEACLIERVATWRFPEPAGGGTVEVNYPFLFRAD